MQPGARASCERCLKEQLCAVALGENEIPAPHTTLRAASQLPPPPLPGDLLQISARFFQIAPFCPWRGAGSALLRPITATACAERIAGVHIRAVICPPGNGPASVPSALYSIWEISE